MIPPSNPATRRGRRLAWAFAPFAMVGAFALWEARVPASVGPELQDMARALVPAGSGTLLGAHEPFSSGMKAGISRVVADGRSCEEALRDYRARLTSLGFEDERVATTGRGDSHTWLKGDYCASLRCTAERGTPTGSTLSLYIAWQRVRFGRCN